MSHEKYWEYLRKLSLELDERFRKFPDSFKRVVFKLTASPYHYWLENRAAMGSVPIPPPTEAGSPSNLADKAQEIRSKARAAIKTYMRTKEKSMPSDASLEIWQLAATYAEGKSIYKALDIIPDIELVNWNTKHGVFL